MRSPTHLTADRRDGYALGGERGRGTRSSLARSLASRGLCSRVRRGAVWAYDATAAAHVAAVRAPTPPDCSQPDALVSRASAAQPRTLLGRTNALACRQWCHHVDFGAGRRQRGMERSAATAAPSHLWTKCGTPRRRSADRGHTAPTRKRGHTCFHSIGVFIFPICFHFSLFVFMKPVLEYPGLNSWIRCDQILLVLYRELVMHNLPRPETGVLV